MNEVSLEIPPPTKEELAEAHEKSKEDLISMVLRAWAPESQDVYAVLLCQALKEDC